MKKRIGVMPVLVLAHAQIHKVVSGMMLLTSIPTFNAMVIGTIGVAIFRFFWRTTTFYRGALVDKIVEHWLGTHVEPIRSRQASIRSPSSRQATSNALGKVPSALMDDEDVVIIEDRYEASKFLLATELSYEIILEIATVFFAPILETWMLPHHDAFAFHKPQTSIPIWAMVLTQLLCFTISDHVFLQLNTNYLAKLPFHLCWRNIRKNRLRIYPFLIYGALSMGVVCQCYFMYRAPRFGLCKDARDAYCDFWDVHKMEP
ncbi:hypothetical protein M427DRAFT_357620 [Gonapodya prolifera JEL478]|uniref:Uncharacterized protein n=1 Tax=Gonapodya prolifera (strain JEL478) TaxID=1344416 RepID=A0A139AAS1_GONPJ|nr:hypothetical protein M427DRAFT_357620 [Gonapodya prolifera JEL478]|eukprot:KXS13808.1 hypothetical protein M427DRAFT_357620 [Gonapodya prolifera JEL478]